MTDGQLVGLVLLAAALALIVYGAWDLIHAVWVDEDEMPL